MAEVEITRVEFSGVADGKSLEISQVATAGNTIHTADATAYDEIWAWARNSSTAAVRLTVEWGGVVDADNLHYFDVPPAGTPAMLIVPGWILTNGLLFAAFAASASTITITGYVNRIE